MDLGALKKSLAQGETHLGDFVFWALEEARQDVAKVLTAFEKEALGHALPKPPGWPKAIRRAVEAAKRGKPPEIIVTLARDDGGVLSYAILRKTADREGNVTTTQTGKVVHEESSYRWDGTTFADPIAKEIVDGATDLVTKYTGEDIAKTIVEVLKSEAAFALRPNGGVYFVPRTSADRVRALQRAVEAVGKCRLGIVPVHRTAEGTPTLAEAAQGSLEAEVAEVQREILAFAEEVQAGGEGPRASTLERRLESFEAIRAKAKVYETVLTFSASGINEGLAKLERVIEAIVTTSASRATAA